MSGQNNNMPGLVPQDHDMDAQSEEEAEEVERALLQDDVEAKRRAGVLAEQYRFECVCS
jgi:hypothetical protein